MVALLQMNGLQVNAPVPNERQNCSADTYRAATL